MALLLTRGRCWSKRMKETAAGTESWRENDVAISASGATVTPLFYALLLLLKICGTEDKLSPC